MDEFKDDIEHIISIAKRGGIYQFIVVGFDIESSIKAKTMSLNYPEIKPVYGIHPYNTVNSSISIMKELNDLVKEKEPLAIGETGFDFYRDISPKKKQRDFFEAHIELASQYNLPLVIHTRDAFDETYAILKEYNRFNDILHCYTGNLNDIGKFNELNIYYGITGIITFKNSNLRAIVKEMPLNRILIETDSPYLSPVPFRGKRNEPSNLKFIFNTLSESVHINYQNLENILLKNTKRAFNCNFDEC